MEEKISDAMFSTDESSFGQVMIGFNFFQDSPTMYFHSRQQHCPSMDVLFFSSCITHNERWCMFSITHGWFFLHFSHSTSDEWCLLIPIRHRPVLFSISQMDERWAMCLLGKEFGGSVKGLNWTGKYEIFEALIILK